MAGMPPWFCDAFQQAVMCEEGFEMTWIKRGAQGIVTVLATLDVWLLFASGRSVVAAEDEHVDPLVGVRESVSPAQVDCGTRQPLPDAPIIRAVYTIQHGGTMTEENTDPIEGSYWLSGVGVGRCTGRTHLRRVLSALRLRRREPAADEAAGSGGEGPDLHRLSA